MTTLAIVLLKINISDAWLLQCLLTTCQIKLFISDFNIFVSSFFSFRTYFVSLGIANPFFCYNLQEISAEICSCFPLCLNLKWFFYKQHIIGSHFPTHFLSSCLEWEGGDSFTFKLITDKENLPLLVYCIIHMPYRFLPLISCTIVF